VAGRGRLLLATLCIASACSGDDVAPEQEADPGGGPATIETPAASNDRPQAADDVDEPADSHTEPARLDISVGDDPTSALIISEVMYHPVDDDADAEFVEILNRSTQSVDVEGWCLDGVKFCFDPGSLEPGSFLVVPTRGTNSALSNGGEELALVDPAGNLVDIVDYDDRAQWPALADGDGLSLQRRDPDVSGSNPGNWIAETPTPGSNTVSSGPPLPTWSGVTFDRLPEAGQEIRVSGTVDAPAGVVDVRVEYIVGFGTPVTVNASIDPEGRVTATLPGNPAGSLVRLRLVASTIDGAIGTWPRQGDGADYVGTTVELADGSSTDLPRIEWFLEDDDYEAARWDLDGGGDEYGFVLAVDGEVFDNATMSVRGESSLADPKPKWKIRLPAGHELTIAGTVIEGVDQILLNSSWTDPSFVREVLAAEAMDAAGADPPHAFHVQVERNGAFYGLYVLVEAPDDDWRERIGVDDGVVYEVASGPDTPAIAATSADLPETDLRALFEPETGAGDDIALREFIRRVSANDRDEARRWILDHVDVGDVIDMLAAAELIQSEDFRRKNYRLVLRPDGMWTTKPWDLDLTYGRRFEIGCATTCAEVSAIGVPNPSYGEFFEFFRSDPDLSRRLDERLASLADVVLDPAKIAARIDELKALVLDEARRDREVWGTYGSALDPEAAMAAVVDAFVVPQRAFVDAYLAEQGLAE
jgi:CotH kinase protein/Lamin Tail Domain